MTGRVGRDLRPDDVRIVAAKEMNLRGNAVINVIDPTKSYQPTFPNAAATCVIARRSIDARNDVVYRYRIEAYNHRFESYVPYEVAEYRDVSDAEPVIIVGAGPAGLFAALKLIPAENVDHDPELYGAFFVRRAAQSLRQHVGQLVGRFDHMELVALFKPHAGFLIVPLPGMAAVIAEVSEGIRVAAVLWVFLFPAS